MENPDCSNRQRVRAKIRQVFPGRQVADIMAELDRYGVAGHERERTRVQLAILKLCEEQGLDDPSYYVEQAKQDYRDVIAWAEYPNRMRTDAGRALSQADRDRLAETDLQQYRDWLGPDIDDE